MANQDQLRRTRLEDSLEMPIDLTVANPRAKLVVVVFANAFPARILREQTDDLAQAPLAIQSVLRQRHIAKQHVTRHDAPDVRFGSQDAHAFLHVLQFLQQRFVAHLFGFLVGSDKFGGKVMDQATHRVVWRHAFKARQRFEVPSQRMPYRRSEGLPQRARRVEDNLVPLDAVASGMSSELQ